MKSGKKIESTRGWDGCFCDDSWNCGLELRVWNYEDCSIQMLESRELNNRTGMFDVMKCLELKFLHFTVLTWSLSVFIENSCNLLRVPAMLDMENGLSYLSWRKKGRPTSDLSGI